MHRAQAKFDLAVPFKCGLNVFMSDKTVDAERAERCLQGGGLRLDSRDVTQKQPQPTRLPNTILIRRSREREFASP